MNDIAFILLNFPNIASFVFFFFCLFVRFVLFFVLFSVLFCIFFVDVIIVDFLKPGLNLH